MDLTDTLTDHSEDGAVDGQPMLPTLPLLPSLPVLPPTSQADRSAGLRAATPPDLTVSLPAARVSVSSQRTNLAANAPYGALPGKPRAGEPSPAAVHAAEQRRRTKTRRRFRRLALLVIAIAVIALAGPPAARWIADGFDKAGSIETESPVPGDDTD
jgi:hypothetical protein